MYRGAISGGGALLVTLGDVRTYYDSGLINGRTYYYQVSATNAAGEGVQSNEVSSTPPQVVGITWIRQFGGLTSSYDYVRSISVDASGVYVGGDTTGTLSGETNVGGADAFLKKYDTTGNVTWTRQFGTILDDHLFAVVADTSGVYVAGDTLGTFPGQVAAGRTDVFLLKYDTNGNVLWTRQFGSPNYDFALAAGTDASGVYVAGTTSGVLPGEINAGGDDAFLEKYDGSGNLLWTRQFGTASWDYARGVATDATGVYVAGNTLGVFSGQTNAGGVDTFLRKYAADGTYLWTREFGTAAHDVPSSIATDASGVYLIGATGGTFPGETRAGGYDVFLRKYDVDGNPQWTREFGTAADENVPAGLYGGFVYGVVALTTSGVYVFGDTSGTFAGQTRAGCKAPRSTLPGIERSVHDFRICRVQDDIATAGPRVVRRWCLQDKLPVFASISRLEKTALAAIDPEMAARGDVRHFRFRRMDDDAPDGTTLLQSGVLPVFTSIGGTINAIPPAGGITIVRFARSHPDHTGIGRRDGNGPD